MSSSHGWAPTCLSPFGKRLLDTPSSRRIWSSSRDRFNKPPCTSISESREDLWQAVHRQGAAVVAQAAAIGRSSSLGWPFPARQNIFRGDLASSGLRQTRPPQAAWLAVRSMPHGGSYSPS